jgi:hypothetical protein
MDMLEALSNSPKGEDGNAALSGSPKGEERNAVLLKLNFLY